MKTKQEKITQIFEENKTKQKQTKQWVQDKKHRSYFGYLT